MWACMCLWRLAGRHQSPQFELREHSRCCHICAQNHTVQSKVKSHAKRRHKSSLRLAAWDHTIIALPGSGTKSRLTTTHAHLNNRSSGEEGQRNKSQPVKHSRRSCARHTRRSCAGHSRRPCTRHTQRSYAVTLQQRNKYDCAFTRENLREMKSLGDFPVAA